jgi:hypothetical protein
VTVGWMTLPPSTRWMIPGGRKERLPPYMRAD